MDATPISAIVGPLADVPDHSPQRHYIALETQRCRICAASYATGALAAVREGQPVLDRYIQTGWGLCPQHEAMHEGGLVALVEIDVDKCRLLGSRPDGMAFVDAERVHRTGEILHLPRTLASLVLSPKERIATGTEPLYYVQRGTIAQVQRYLLRNQDRLQDESEE